MCSQINFLSHPVKLLNIITICKDIPSPLHIIRSTRFVILFIKFPVYHSGNLFGFHVYVIYTRRGLKWMRDPLRVSDQLLILPQNGSPHLTGMLVTVVVIASRKTRNQESWKNWSTKNAQFRNDGNVSCCSGANIFCCFYLCFWSFCPSDW